ncbi:MAG: isocitrate lyase/phosphoenolpyruvate mutase family protein [Bacteroidota bacterium]
MNTQEKFDRFKSMHIPGNPILLYNIWNAGSAQAAVKAGAAAIATGSKPLAMSQGYPDGEVMTVDQVITTVKQIVKSVEVPMSVDFEGGYAGNDLDLLAQNIRKIIETGIVGINFEDQVVGTANMYDIDTQVKRIQTIRKTADDLGSSLFINARTDIFLKEKDKSKHGGLIEEAVTRAQAFQEAGGDCFFAPGLYEGELIEELCKMVDLPVNILKSPTAPGVAELAKLGVARISFGPFAYLDLMSSFEEKAKELFG